MGSEVSSVCGLAFRLRMVTRPDVRSRVCFGLRRSQPEKPAATGTYHDIRSGGSISEFPPGHSAEISFGTSAQSAPSLRALPRRAVVILSRSRGAGIGLWP
jgi:hypothetical protein